MYKWNDYCVYIDFLFRFSVVTRRPRSWPIKLERQMYLAWFWEEKKEKQKLLTSTENTHTMGTYYVDGDVWPEQSDQVDGTLFYTLLIVFHCMCRRILWAFFFIILSSILNWCTLCTLLGIKTRSNPIAKVHSVHSSCMALQTDAHAERVRAR